MGVPPRGGRSGCPYLGIAWRRASRGGEAIRAGKPRTRRRYRSGCAPRAPPGGRRGPALRSPRRSGRLRGPEDTEDTMAETKFAQFIAAKKLDHRRILAASFDIEKLRPEDR